MVLKILVLVSIIAGGLIGYSTAEQKIIYKKALVKCDDVGKSKVFEDADHKRCITRLVNKGEDFKRNEESIKYKLFNFFKIKLADHNKNPNKHNIYLKKPKGKKQFRQYDPRLDHFVRFGVKDFVLDNSSIDKYSVFPKKVKSVEKILEKLSCSKPQFSKIRNMKDLKVFQEYRSAEYEDKNKANSKQFNRKDFSAFQELEKKLGWYMYFTFNRNNIENFLLANHCNKSISLVLNHCIVDPSLDMQMEEIFWFKENKKVGINIYCKKSNEKKWKVVKSKVLTKKL